MKKKVKLTIEDIEDTWGSYEAYLEEQRRLGMYNLEAKAIEVPNPGHLLTGLLHIFDAKPVHSEPTPCLIEQGFAALTDREIDRLTFIRWLYSSGRLES